MHGYIKEERNGGPQRLKIYEENGCKLAVISCVAFSNKLGLQNKFQDSQDYMDLPYLKK